MTQRRSRRAGHELLRIQIEAQIDADQADAL